MFKPKPRHLTIFFITVFIIQMILLVVLLLLPAESRAADVKFQPQITIPGSSKFSAEKIKQCQAECESKGDKKKVAECKQGCGISVGTQVGDKIVSTLLGEYIRDIYKYAVGIVGILAAVVLMFGGVVWLTAGGNQTRIGEAKAWIGASLTGLIIVLTSYMILYTVNPALVNFRPIEIGVVKKAPDTGRCRIPSLSSSTNDQCFDNMKEEDCIGNPKYGTWGKGLTCPTSCCAWDIATAATALCQLSFGCSGNLYNNCDDTQKNLTVAQCNTKAGSSFKQYMATGKCSKRTLVGTSNTLVGYECVK